MPLIIVVVVVAAPAAADDNNNVSNNWLCSLGTFPCQMKEKNPDAKV